MQCLGKGEIIAVIDKSHICYKWIKREEKGNYKELPVNRNAILTHS